MDFHMPSTPSVAFLSDVYSLVREDIRVFSFLSFLYTQFLVEICDSKRMLAIKQLSFKPKEEQD
jgi:hypothetical protein